MTHCHTIIDRMREVGIRITPQREMIIQTVAHAEDHLTPDQIYAVVRDRSRAVNLATIYRTLDLLVAQGYVCRTMHPTGKVMYSAQHNWPHIHLICRKCHQTFELDTTLLESNQKEITREYSFTIDLNHISFTGVCAGCDG